MAQAQNEPTLPIVDPSSQRDATSNDGSASANNRRYCWRSMFGHTMAEIGLSPWVPWWILILTRLVSGGILIFAVIAPNVVSQVQSIFELFVRSVQATSFILLAVGSMLAARGSENMIFASIVVPMHHFGSTFALLYVPYYLFLARYYGIFLLGIAFGSFALFLSDSFVFQARLCFRNAYFVFPLLAYFIYYIIIRATGLEFVSWTDPIMWVLGCVVASSFVTLVTRLDLIRCCSKRPASN